MITNIKYCHKEAVTYCTMFNNDPSHMKTIQTTEWNLMCQKFP